MFNDRSFLEDKAMRHNARILAVLGIVGLLVSLCGCGLMDAVKNELLSGTSSGVSIGSWTIPGSVGTDTALSSPYMSSPSQLYFTPASPSY